MSDIVRLQQYSSHQFNENDKDNFDQNLYLYQTDCNYKSNSTLLKIIISLFLIQVCFIRHMYQHNTNTVHHNIYQLVNNNKALMLIIMMGIMSWISIKASIVTCLIGFAYFLIHGIISILPIIIIAGLLAISYIKSKQYNSWILVASCIILLYALFSTLLSIIFIPKMIFIFGIKTLCIGMKFIHNIYRLI